MPTKREKSNLRPAPLQAILLLIKYALLKTGQLPLLPFFTIRLLLWKRGQTKAVAIAIISLMLIYFYTIFILSVAYQLPSPDRLNYQQTPLTTEIYDRKGQLLYRLYEGRNRTLVKLEELPPYLIQATIAIEDQNFYKHTGVDFAAMLRALYNNLTRRNSKLEGASTITQQLIKNNLLTPEKTYSRKIKEIILSLWAEQIYSKNQILQMYFNEAPYGGPTWGIGAAAQVYFGKIPKDLTLAQSAFLAGLPASPTEFSPYGTRPELGKMRQKEVLKRLVEEKYITLKQAEEAEEEVLTFRSPQNEILAPHFVFYVKDYLSQKYGPAVVSQGGLKIYTTLDLDLQKEAEKITSAEISSLSFLNVQNGAAMVTDAKTGQILAMVGSRDYHYPNFGNFNVTLSPRQPGSSIKVVTYAAAFKAGYSPGNTILDRPVSFKDPRGKSYTPVNYDGIFRGPVSIREALGSSLNIPAVKILYTIGLDSMIQTAKDLGITTFTQPQNYGLSITLGGADVRMIDMMAVYGTLANYGQLQRVTPILKVLDSSGEVLEEYKKNDTKTAIKPEIAYLITSILTDNSARSLSFGPNSLINLGPTVAVKTGTSDNKRDNWTFGYTRDFVVGVWVGNNDNSPMNPTLTSGVTGAAPIWRKIMQMLLAQYPALAFTKPEGVVSAIVDGRRDFAIAGLVPKGLVKVKTEADKIIFSDSFSSYATTSARATIKDENTN